MKELHYSIQIRSQNRSIVSIDDFSYKPNDITFLFGESGIGKSMISKAIYGLLDPDELQIVINGKPYENYLAEEQTRTIRENSFFVFQEPSSHLNALIKLTRQLREGSLGACDSEQEIVHQLWQTDDDEKLNKVLDIYPKPYRPSGGEKQRVLLAMAFKKITLLTRNKEIPQNTFFVFDEPTGSLDDRYRNLFLEFLFRQYEKNPFTINLITHDYSIISEIYRSYGALIDHIHFKELTRENEGVVSCQDFSPTDYLDWLQKPRLPQKRKLSDGPDEVVQVAAQFKVFGHEHGIYKDAERRILKDLTIRKGEMVYLKAASGIGKTTLAKLIMGLYRAQRLHMTISGIPISEKTLPKVWQRRIWGKCAGMVFQHADEALDLQATVKETFLGLPLGTKMTADVLKMRLHDLFDQEITDTFLNKKVGLLSGGQKQRLNVLRTLVLETDLVILDEPLNGLDFNSIKKVLQLLEEKRQEGVALLMISHNEEIFDHLVEQDNTYYLS